MPAKRRRTRARSPQSQDALRATIIEAARRLFDEGGYEAVTMRKVAVRVGCSAGALYRYFPDKQSLMLYVWEEDIRHAITYIQGAVDGARTPVDKVRQTLIAYLRYWSAHPDNFRILFGPTAEQIERSSSTVLRPPGSATAGYIELRDYLTGLIKEHGSSMKDADLAAQCLLTSAHGIMAMHLSASQFPWYKLDEIGRVSIDAMLTGWGLIEKPTVTASRLKTKKASRFS
jgi:AcrR family transcriptional regulator